MGPTPDGGISYEIFKSRILTHTSPSKRSLPLTALTVHSLRTPPQHTPLYKTMYPANFDTTNGGLANHTPISRDTTKPQASSLSSTLRSALLWFWDHPSGLGRQETTEEHGATRMHTQSPYAFHLYLPFELPDTPFFYSTSPFGVVHPTQNQLPLDVTPTTSTFANT